ncbi:MAG: trigger factor, partial [Anaerolineales bacterium]|nr:trigger factor [Anaerolineales bacterium]
MKIEQSYLEEHQLEVIVEADQETFEKAKHLAAKELAKGKKIPGYRPGKAPYKLIVNHFGEGVIIDQALEHFLDDIYPKILEEVEQEPYGPGQVKEIKSLEPPTFIFNIPLQPEVTLGDYREIRIAYEQSDVSSDDVDEVIGRMLSQQASVEPVEHPAEESNLVDTSLDCYPTESDPEDEDRFLLKSQPLPVMIKTKDEDDSKEWPFPGFSRQLLGVSAGDSLELTHEFPDEETVDEDYRGKEVLYTVLVEGIRERVLPEMDDEFVKTISELETVAELKDQIQEELNTQRETEEENTYINQILEAILEEAEVKFPPQMLDSEIDGEVHELEARLKSQGMDLEMYLGIQDMEEEGLREQIKPNAEKRIIQGLLIGKISEAEDLDINPEEITGEFQSVLDNHFGDDESSRTEYMNSGESVALLNRISSQIITRKTLDFLIAVAKGEDISEFLKPEEVEIEEENGSIDPTDEEIVETPSEKIDEKVMSEEEVEIEE